MKGPGTGGLGQWLKDAAILEVKELFVMLSGPYQAKLMLAHIKSLVFKAIR